MVKEHIRILTVDDDAGVRANIVNYLEDSGYVLFEAESGREGLYILEVEQPDVVLIDLRMPDMGGLAFLEQLARRAPGTPSIVVSGAGVLEEAVAALQLGAWEYVTKPITDMRVLEQAIARCVERAELVRDRNRYQKRLEEEVRERTGELRKSYNDLHAYQSLVQEKNELQRSLLEHMPSPVFYKSAYKGFLGCNELFTRLVSLGGSPRDIIGKNFADIFPLPVSQVLCLAEDLLSQGATGKCCEIDLPGPDGELLRMAVHMGNFRDAQGNIAGVVGSFHDITDLKAKEAHILHQATHDELTGLRNRLGMRRHMEARIRESEGLARFCIIYMDVDNFKTINDSLGHVVGDKILCEIAERLLGHFTDGLVFRPGGDEFMLVSSYGSDAQQALTHARAIHHVLKTPFVVTGQELFVQASYGIALYPEDGVDADTLLKNADLAMYRAKEQGGGGIHRYTAALTQRMTRRLELEKMLRKALEQNEFILLYQPKIHLGSRRVVGVEALLRWSSSLGLIPPSEFIPVAEETGLIIELGKWILREACTQHCQLVQQGLGPLRLSVNISANQLQPSLPALVQEVLKDTGLPPHLLELEITESAMMRDLSTTTQILRNLKARKVRIAIDDFGTGHSSLFYLKNFPVDTLKIDQSFVRDICSDHTDATLVSSILTMAKGLCLETVAEGVEHKDQVVFLSQSGCTEVQGYYYSRPLAADKLVAFVRDFTWS